MTSLPMAVSQETQQPPSVAHLSTLYISLKTDTGQAGYGEPCSIFQQESSTTGITHGKKLRISERVDESQRRVLKHQQRERVEKSRILQQQVKTQK